MQEDVVVPVVLFISIAVAISTALWFRFRGRAEVQHTIRTAIEKGQDLSPELLERLGDAVEPRQRDLRRGIVSVSLALAFGVFAVVLGEQDAFRPILGLASFPLLIGIAYLILARMKVSET
jgi:hypothetical protein